jgi:hypothetical protein
VVEQLSDNEHALGNTLTKQYSPADGRYHRAPCSLGFYAHQDGAHVLG